MKTGTVTQERRKKMELNEYLLRIKKIDARIDTLSESEADRERYERFKAFRDSVKEDIDSIADSTLAVIIEDYYVKDKTWEEIAAKLGYRDPRYVKGTLKERALAELGRIVRKKYTKVHS